MCRGEEENRETVGGTTAAITGYGLKVGPSCKVLNESGMTIAGNTNTIYFTQNTTAHAAWPASAADLKDGNNSSIESK